MFIKKIKNLIKEQIFNVTKPQVIIKARLFVDDNPVTWFFCESLTYNFIQMLYVLFINNSGNFPESPNGYGKQGVKLTTGSFFTTTKHIPRINSGNGIDTFGIVVGTGTTAPTPDNFNMENLINNGTGVGQLSYAPTTGIQACETVNQDTTFIIQRVFTNNSGATINVSELGLIYNHDNLGSSFVLILRDVFSAVTILNSQTLTVQLEFKITT